MRRTLVDVLEHVTTPLELVRETYRVLAPGGVIFINVPHARYNPEATSRGIGAAATISPSSPGSE